MGNCISGEFEILTAKMSYVPFESSRELEFEYLEDLRVIKYNY